MLDPVRHADPLQRGHHPLAALGLGYAVAVGQRQLHIFEHREIADQVERLEDEADLSVSNAGALIGVDVLHRCAVERVAAAGRRIQQTQDRQQGRFAAARRPGNRHVLAFGDIEVHAGKRVGFDLVGVKHLGDGVEVDQGLGGVVHGFGP